MEACAGGPACLCIGRRSMGWIGSFMSDFMMMRVDISLVLFVY
jgi:hypothetical protein